MKKVLVEILVITLLVVQAVSSVAFLVMLIKYIGLKNSESAQVVEVKEETSFEKPEIEEVSVPEVAENASGVPEKAVGNCTTKLGKLMLINANFTVDMNFIYARRNQLINLTEVFGINELNSYNGAPLLDAEAGARLNEMIKAYQTENPGHEMKTVSCFRAYGTSCGRLCAATGTSEHHSGYTCDLIDAAYGTSLDSSYLEVHKEWQWLKANSYKYGFIDRYPIEWAGGSMAQPLNVDENGTTGYYETWHYRYVGNPAANEIATGKYNGGKYDSLEHYLKMTGYIKDLRAGTCN